MYTHTRAVLLLAALAGCGRGQPRDEPQTDAGAVAGTAIRTDSGAVTDTGTPRRAPAVTNARKSIDAVLAAHTDSLMAIPGVLGTAVGRCEDGKPCIRVLVNRVTEELRRRLPPELEGYPVRVDVTGPIVPRP